VGSRNVAELNISHLLSVDNTSIILQGKPFFFLDK
jgi:hypothetical protein